MVAPRLHKSPGRFRPNSRYETTPDTTINTTWWLLNFSQLNSTSSEDIMSMKRPQIAVGNAATQLPVRIPPPSNLLGLPREIRDQIYDQVLRDQARFELHLCMENERFKRYGPVTSFEISYGQPEDLSEEEEQDVVVNPRPYEMSWVKASKQVCTEALEQFQRKAT